MRSILLVLGQFGCIAILLFGGSWLMPWWAWCLFTLGWVIFLWALFSLGTVNFTIMPEPRAGSSLSQRGIYHWLRHPMYTTVLICGGALSFGGPSVARWIALAVVIVVLHMKIRHEEARLTERYPDYPVRMKGVARLFPFIW